MTCSRKIILFLLLLLTSWRITTFTCLAFSGQLLPVSSRRKSLALVVVTMASTVSSSRATSAEESKNDKPDDIRWGIIGLGDVTQVKSGPAFFKCHGCQLSAVMRRTPGKAAEWVQQQQQQQQQSHPNKEPCIGYDSITDFLHHPGGLDAVYIATRPGSHLEIARQVVEAATAAANNNKSTNTKNIAIYVEKPVGRCAAETRALVDLCQQANVLLYTAYISRAYQRTRAIRRLLQDEGVIGSSVTSVEYRLVGTGGARDMKGDLPWRLDASESGGGLIMDVGCHVLDRIDWLCGPLIPVTGRAEKRGAIVPNDTTKGVVEDYVSINALIGPSDWASIPSEGATVSCTWDFSGQETEDCDELIIRGPKGCLKMAAMSPSLPVAVCDPQGNVLRTLEFETPQHTAQEMIQAVTDELRGVGSAPFLSRGDNALRTAQVMDTVLKNYYGNRDIGYWSAPDKWPGAPTK